MRADRRWRFEAETAPKRALPSVKARAVLGTVVVVALALGVASAVLFYVLQRSMISGIAQASAARASDIADRVTIVGESDLQKQLSETARRDQVIQVIRGDGEDVVATSGPATAPSPFTQLRARPGEVKQERAGPRKILDGRRPYLVMVRGAQNRNGGQVYSIIVATSLTPQKETLKALGRFAMVGIPALLLVVGVGSWFLISRALAPVEAMRGRVATIGAGDLDDRVPIPPTRDEIARLAATMNMMLDRLQAAQQAQRQFVADASHELRSPLATLAATLEVAAADPTGRAWQDLKAVMEGETARMSVLVENLLLLAKVDDQGLMLNVEDVDLDDLLEGEADRLRKTTGLAVRTAIHPVRVRGDVLRLGQAVRNLVDNAARHARSQVALTVRVQGEVAVITVADDGLGVPEAERERVFERFVRLDDSRARSSGGSGLGLPIVREVVRGHAGRVGFTDPPANAGCQVVMVLPLERDDDGARPASTGPADRPAAPAPAVDRTDLRVVPRQEEYEQDEYDEPQPPSASSR